MKHTLLLVVAAALLTGGCKSNPSQKPPLTRGWIGGDYGTARKNQVPKGQSSRVYVKQVQAGTPAEQAGLKTGDLVLDINGQPVERLGDFRRCVDSAKPGSRTAIRVLRDGQPLELPLTVGRETYQQWHAFQIGLGLSSRLDLWPDPDFSVVSLLEYRRPQDRLELRSAEVILAKQAEKSAQDQKQGETGRYSHEGWRAWLLIFGVDAHKRILTQEEVPQTTAMR
jgi:hypothetical protein